MKAYIKTNKWLKQINKAALPAALQYLFLAISVTGYAYAQQADPGPAKAGQSERKILPEEGSAGQSTTEPSESKGKTSEGKAAPTANDTQKPAELAKQGETVLPTVVIKDRGLVKLIEILYI